MMDLITSCMYHCDIMAMSNWMALMGDHEPIDVPDDGAESMKTRCDISMYTS